MRFGFPLLRDSSTESAKCVFCDIVKGNAPSVIIKESKDFLAILDKYPSSKGMTVIISKGHTPADWVELRADLLQKASVFSQDTAKLLVKKLKTERVFFVIEGMEVNHFHIKLYPTYTRKPSPFREVRKQLEYRFDMTNYPDFVATFHGKEKTTGELKKVREELR